MIEYIKGELTELTPALATVEAAGVGYGLNISLTTYSALQGIKPTANGQKPIAKLYVFESIREDAHVLYGFVSKKEREMFELLITVSGVGPNTARMMLSSMSVSELCNAISRGDERLIKGIKGIGKMTAQRIIVDLRDKIVALGIADEIPAGGSVSAPVNNEVRDEAVSALTMLGFAPAPTQKVVVSILQSDPNLPVEQVVKLALVAVLLCITAMAMPPQDDKTQKKNPAAKAQPTLQIADDTIPDSLLHARWKIQKTAPIEVADLDSSALDLRLPENIKQQVEYDDSLGYYRIGSKIGDSYLNTPILMTPEEYNKWSERREREAFFRKKESENVATQGKEKFSFADMHFDLGPAEKIFGPGGVRIKTQGTAELKLGATLKDIDNPSLPERNRKTTAVDFDEKINLNVTGKVGDKVNMSLNYNTDATFDFDTKNLKLHYDGKEDEIIKLVEAGNITFPSNNSLVKGASSLFGVRTDMQFGKLKLQTAISRKNSTTKSVSSQGGTQMTPFELDVANYEENRHFFLAKYFREHYDAAMSQLPNILTGINITRIEVWVTNKTGTTSNSRNLIALSELGESQPKGGTSPSALPDNNVTPLYGNMPAAARDIDQASTALQGMLEGGTDYEKMSSARLLNSSEYTLNTALGYLSLKTSLQTDQVLAVAFRYTYGGMEYQVGG